MKKVLSIVLALAMVLCMIPMMAAETTKTVTIEKQKYDIAVHTIQDDAAKMIGSAKDANSVEAKYLFSKVKKAQTGKWTEDKKMSIVAVDGFSFNEKDDVTITINGKKLDVSENASYKDITGYDTYKKFGKGKKNFGGDKYSTYIAFPAELTEAGYTENYLITATWKDGDTEYTEIAKITVKFSNTEEAAKGTKTAYITNIAKNADDKANVVVYIVGSKIYADFATEPVDFVMDVTFADENKAAFTAITYLYDPACDAFDLVDGKTFVGETVEAEKLVKSVAKIDVDVDEKDAKDVQFELESEASKYKTDKKYTLVCRSYIHEEDPKGIYLEKSDVTIAVGEEYTPVVKAISNGAALTPSSILIYDSFGKFNTAVLDYVGDQYDNKVIGVKPGVAYIKVTYGKDYDKDSFYYTSSAQKITVTLPGASTPAQSVEYTVTCRNLNVRKGAGTSFAKAGMVHRGDKLAVVEIANGWAKLADGTFVCAKYITK